MRQINKWKILTEDIVDIWIREYFGISEDEDVDFEWIGSEVGGVFEFADYFINFSDVLNCYKYKITKREFHEWYDYCTDNQYVNISLAKFILSPEERDKKEKENLERLKECVIFAEQEFKKALENYKK